MRAADAFRTSVRTPDPASNSDADREPTVRTGLQLTHDLPAALPVTHEEIDLLLRTIGSQFDRLWSDAP